MKILIEVLLISMITIILGCNSNEPNNTSQIAESAEKQASTNITCFSKSIVVLIDKSKSTSEHNMPQPSLSDFKRLIDHVRDCGGSLAVGCITENSDKVFVTLRVLDKKPEKPIKPGKEHYPNDFDFRDAYNAYHRKIEKYENHVNKWNTNVKQLLENFESELVNVLGKPATALNTDIHRALNKAEVYHNSCSGYKPYTIIISDGKDDVGAELSGPMSTSEVFLVYGSSNPEGEWLNKYTPINKADLETAIMAIIGEKIPKN